MKCDNAVMKIIVLFKDVLSVAKARISFSSAFYLLSFLQKGEVPKFHSEMTVSVCVCVHASVTDNNCMTPTTMQLNKYPCCEVSVALPSVKAAILVVIYF